MPQNQGGSSSAGGRIDGSIGAALAAGDVAIGAGWGTTATKAISTGANAQRGTVTVTSAGTGQAQATATVIITFPDGAYAAQPHAIVTVDSTSAIDEGHVAYTVSTTALTITFSVLPVATKLYALHYVVSQ